MATSIRDIIRLSTSSSILFSGYVALASGLLALQNYYLSPRGKPVEHPQTEGALLLSVLRLLIDLVERTD